MHFLRPFYYWLSPGLRLFVRRVFYFPADIFSVQKRKGKLLPPKGMIFTGSGDFLKDGERWCDLLRTYGLKHDDAVLDIGSGIGRIAVGLTEYLSTESRYEGFDIMKVGVDWCVKNISSQYPHFHFSLIELKNDLYRTNGESAEKLTFPYEKKAFDFAVATSLFTHMLPEETANYFHQVSRTLKNGGKMVATFFVHHKANPETNAHISFEFIKDEYALHNEHSKAANVRYDFSLLEEMAKNAGLIIDQVDYGYWRGTKKSDSKDFQDILVLRKP
ncbi:MAG: class I SAM-dependent methyltransferase [Salibacteraceae bacterium]